MEERNFTKVICLILFLIFVAIMSLIIINGQNAEHETLMSRADYLIAKSEASIARWNHGNR